MPRGDGCRYGAQLKSRFRLSDIAKGKGLAESGVDMRFSVGAALLLTVAIPVAGCSQSAPEADVPGCGIVYSNHTAWQNDLSKEQLLQTPMEVRARKGQPGWILVLKVEPTHTSKASVKYEAFPVVTDPAQISQAKTDCITNVGQP
jgi:hypothetical protein